MMKRGGQTEQARQDEQARQNRAEQAKRNWENCGCFAIIAFALVGAFLIMATGLSLGLVRSMAPVWPLWACYLVGAIIALVTMTLLFLMGGDLMDRLGRAVIIAILVGLLAPIFARARENAMKQRAREIALQKAQQQSTAQSAGKPFPTPKRGMISPR